jgi:hypothetical protein
MASSMKQFNCEYFSIIVKFNERDFKKKDFLEDTKPKDKDIKINVYHYGSKTNGGKDHAHLELFLDGKNSLLRITYHQGETPEEDVREPYLEDCTKWISGFFKKQTLAIDYTGVFRYDKTYDSIVPLEFPLLSTEKKLKGVSVYGYQLEFPKDSLIDNAYISAQKGNKLIVLTTVMKKWHLLGQDFYSNLEEFSNFAKALVIKKGAK